MALNVKDFSSHRELVDFANGSNAVGLISLPERPDTIPDGLRLNIPRVGGPTKIEADRDAAVTPGNTLWDVSNYAPDDVAAAATALAVLIAASDASLTAVASGRHIKVTNVDDGAAGNGEITITDPTGDSALSAEMGKAGWKLGAMSGGGTAIPFANQHGPQLVRGRWFLFWDA